MVIIKMKNKLARGMGKLPVIIVLLILGSSLSHAASFIPRLGVSGGVFWTEDNTSPVNDSDHPRSLSYGFNGGVVMVMQDSFVDISFDSISYDIGLTAPVDLGQPNVGWRSEVNLTGGYRLVENLYGLVGLRQAVWGESVFSDDGASFNGLFVGISINNLEVDRDLMSIMVGQVIGDWKTDFAKVDAEGALFKISWREKGARSLWSVKWTDVGSALSDISVMFGYTYLFI